MREIKFRGKRKGTGEWVYGSYSWGFSIYRQSQYRTIVNPIGCNCIESYEVNPSTVGQFTGRLDINEVEIFKDDIIENYTGRRCQVIWFESPEYCGWDLRAINSEGKPPLYSMWDSNVQGWVVIGNIHDNPELLEV